MNTQLKCTSACKQFIHQLLKCVYYIILYCNHRCFIKLIYSYSGANGYFRVLNQLVWKKSGTMMRDHQGKTIIFQSIYLFYFEGLQTRFTSAASQSCTRTQIYHLIRSGTVWVSSQEKHFMKSLFAAEAGLNLEFNDIYRKLPVADKLSSRRCHATLDMWNESRGLLVTKRNAD